MESVAYRQEHNEKGPNNLITNNVIKSDTIFKLILNDLYNSSFFFYKTDVSLEL